MRWARSEFPIRQPRAISAAADGRFLFGYDARANVIREADALPARAGTPLVRRPPYEVQPEPRQRPANVKEAIIVEREFTNLRLEAEPFAAFPYQPIACAKAYRMVVLRKNISVEQGDQRLFDEIRYCFYLTNDHETAAARRGSGCLTCLAPGRAVQRESGRGEPTGGGTRRRARTVGLDA